MKTKILIIILIEMTLLCGIYAQKPFKGLKIKGVSTYFPGMDSIEVSRNDLSYLLKHSIVVCSKVDTLDDGAMMKTVEIACSDTTFKFVGAYMESNLVQPSELRSYVMEGKRMTLKCAFVVIDQGVLYETYELDDFGKKSFESLLNRAPLKCIDYSK